MMINISLSQVQRMELIYVDSLPYPITNLGPGKRIGIWVQGCSHNCKGCMSPHTKIQRQENLQLIDSILNEILPIAQQFDGVTVSGGEPFEQADALTRLLIKIRQETDLDILVYTGFTLDEIKNGSIAMKKLLDQIDVLIDGPFMEHLSNTKLWRGSDNQVMHLLTPRSQKYRQFINAKYSGKRQLQIELTAEGELRITGIPERSFFRNFNRKIYQRGIEVIPLKE